MRIKGGEDEGLNHQFGTRETAECSFYNWMVLEHIVCWGITLYSACIRKLLFYEYDSD